MLNQRALAYLCEIVRRGSFRRAADQLNIDVSVVSRKIKALEESLGVSVLHRDSSGVQVTESGQYLVDHFQSQLSAEKVVLSQLQAVQGLVSGQVSIAVGEGFIADLVSEPLESFMTDYPGIELDVTMAGMDEAIGLVIQGHVDFALLYAPPVDAQLECHVETKHPLDVIVPAGHPLMALNRQVTLRDIEGYPLGLMNNPFGMRHLVNAVAHQERIHLQARLHTNSVAVLRNFVVSGIGVTFMPQLTVIDALDGGDIGILEMAHPALNGATAQIVSRQGRELTVSANACLKHLQRGMRFFNSDAPRLLS
ncbi:LysR family transcriptional regulator [Onishia taeanensis]